MNVISVLNIGYLHYSDGSDQPVHPHISNQSFRCPLKTFGPCLPTVCPAKTRIAD